MSLAIRETCACGAEITAASQYASDARKAVTEWRMTHACPGSRTVATPTDSQD